MDVLERVSWAAVPKRRRDAVPEACGPERPAKLVDGDPTRREPLEGPVSSIASWGSPSGVLAHQALTQLPAGDAVLARTPTGVVRPASPPSVRSWRASTRRSSATDPSPPTPSSARPRPVHPPSSAAN